MHGLWLDQYGEVRGRPIGDRTMSEGSGSDLDPRVRLHIYKAFVDAGRFSRFERLPNVDALFRDRVD